MKMGTSRCDGELQAQPRSEGVGHGARRPGGAWALGVCVVALLQAVAFPTFVFVAIVASTSLRTNIHGRSSTQEISA